MALPYISCRSMTFPDGAVTWSEPVDASNRDVFPVLSIAIPTYNRAECLSRLLSELAEQVRGERAVELLISDNASTDHTQSVVQEYLDDGIPIRYIRNAENLGADRNILQCYESAAGVYIWIVGDDDVITLGAVRKILDYLAGADYDLVFVSNYGFRDVYIRPQGSGRQSKSPQVLTTPRDFVRRVNILCTFISANIVNKARVSSATHAAFADLIGTNLIQLGWIYTAINNHRKSLYIPEKLVATRVNNTGGYRLFTVFGTNLQRISDEWLHNRRLSRIVINSALQGFFPHLLLITRVSAHEFVSEDAHAVLSSVFRRNFRYWLFNYPILRLPLAMAKLWFMGVRVINKLDRLLGQPITGLSV